MCLSFLITRVLIANLCANQVYVKIMMLFVVDLINLLYISDFTLRQIVQSSPDGVYYTMISDSFVTLADCLNLHVKLLIIVINWETMLEDLLDIHLL